MASKLLKADEVAAILGVSKSFVYQIVRTGQLPAVHIGTAVRVRPEDLEAFVQENLALKNDPWLSLRGSSQH